MKIGRLPILVAVGVVVLGAGGVLGTSFFLGAPLPLGPKAAEGEHAHSSAAVTAGVPYPMRERIVNLADMGVLRYLKVSIVLEVFDPENPQGATGDDHKAAKPELPKDLRNKHAPMEDNVTTVLSSKTAGELMAIDGKPRLKEELQRSLNALLGGERVRAVYFTDFIIQ